MNNYVGLSFSAENISYAHFIKNEQNFTLENIGIIEYPFQYNENVFFVEDNIIRIANLINNKFKSLQIENATISISIESNLTKLKRILLPTGLSKEEESEQINWDLKQSVLESIDEYVYLITPNYIEIDSLKNVLVIAIKKNIVDFYQRLVSFAKINLENLGVNQLSAEVCFHKALGDIDGLNILFKLTENLVETIYLWNGNYYTSNYDRLLLKQQNRGFNDIIIETISSKIKYIENLFEQLEHKPISVSSIYLYGSKINSEIMTIIKKNVSISVEIFYPLNNLQISPNMEKNLQSIRNITNYVECIGVALDT